MGSESVELGRALTGEELPLVATDLEELVAELATLGWDATRLRELRRQRQSTRQPWPMLVSLDVRRELGFARFDARLAELRQMLGLSGQHACTQIPGEWGDADRRLAADRPPHWG